MALKLKTQYFTKMNKKTVERIQELREVVGYRDTTIPESAKKELSSLYSKFVMPINHHAYGVDLVKIVRKQRGYDISNDNYAKMTLLEWYAAICGYGMAPLNLSNLFRWLQNEAVCIMISYIYEYEK